MNDNRANGPTYDNVGFQHEAGITPPSAPPLDTGPSLPHVTPSYVAVSPNTINTHHTVTPGTPHVSRLKTGIKKYQWKYILCVGVSVLLILAIVGILLWYFLSYQCLLGMTCGSGGKCLSSSQWCDGVEDCSHGEDESQCFRFYGTSSMLEGYSSVKQNWVPVCAENWSHQNGRDVCEQMGYNRLDYVTSTQTSAGVSVSKGYMKLKSGGYYGSFIQSHLFYSQKCSVRAIKLQCVECGVSSAAPSGRIVGGTQAAYGAWPWQVSLQINGYHTCGGSIISPYWILSAAHCFQGRNSDPGMWLVQSGGVSLRQMSYSAGKKVNKIISHAKFNTRTNDNDIALLKVNVPFELTSTVKPVCLPNTDVSLSAGDQGWITGWGAKQSAGPTPDQLNQAQVTIYSRQTCNRVEVLNGDITKTMICAGKLQGGVDACQGDSGGPLVVKKGGVWWLAGDTSWGIGCALRNKPGVYGNVTYFIDWIYEQMQKE